MGYSASGPAPVIPAAGAGGELIFTWNGTDTTQFEGTPAFESGITTGALSVVADTATPLGNKLRMTAAGTGLGVSVFLANLVMPSTRLLIEMDVLTLTDMYAGIAFFGDDSGSYHGYGYAPVGVAGWMHRVDAGVLTTGGTPSPIVSASKSGLLRFIIDGVKPGGGLPRFQISGFGGADVSPVTTRLRNDGYGGEPAAASWNSLTANRWGLFLQASAGNAPGTLDLQGLRVYDIG